MDTDTSATSTAPQRAGLVLGALILVATVANLNLAVANVALPDIGKAFDAAQTQLNLVAVGYSLGLAGSVLYLGALGDRYGRKMMLLLGVGLSIPACALAAWAPLDRGAHRRSRAGRRLGRHGLPDDLALITALWTGPGRTRSIALWSALGGAMSAMGPLIAGYLLGHFWWGSVFLVTLPLAAVAFVMAVRLVPAHVNETTDAVDNLGGVLSIFAVAALVLGINFAPVPDEGTLAVGLLVLAVVATVLFVLRQRRAANPLYDLEVAARRTFWVAAIGGIIVFGSLMAAMFVGQQYLQNVLGYSPIEAGLSILPAVAFMVVVAPRSAKLVETRGARFTLLLGYLFCLLGFATMWALWTDSSAYWQVGLGYALVGIGVGFAGTPASHSLTSSVPVRRAGMASGTADLQRDLGGAIMQSLLGALLTAGYAAAFTAEISASAEASSVSSATESQLVRSFASAEATAQQYPQYADQITAAARERLHPGPGLGLRRGRRWRSSSVRPSWPGSSPAGRRSSSSSASYAAQDAAEPHRSVLARRRRALRVGLTPELCLDAIEPLVQPVEVAQLQRGVDRDRAVRHSLFLVAAIELVDVAGGDLRGDDGDGQESDRHDPARDDAALDGHRIRVAVADRGDGHDRPTTCASPDRRDVRPGRVPLEEVDDQHAVGQQQASPPGGTVRCDPDGTAT